MTTIQSPEHLLQHVARKGDPSAFYSLVAPNAHATYQEIRNSGKNHKDAMLQLVPFLKKLYRGFPKKSDDADFDSWYRNERKKHCDGVPESGHTSSEETFLERISESDLSHLDSQMKLLFMRNYSKIRKQRRGGGIRTGSGILGLGARGTWLLAAVCFCTAAIAFHFFLSFSHIQISIGVDSPSFRHSIHLPSAINKRLFPGKGVSPQPLSIPVVTSSDSASKKGLNSSDSMLKAAALAKNVPDVMAVSKPRQSIPRKTPSADTGATFQQRVQNYPLPSVSQPPRPAITGNEKATPSLSMPQKQRPERPDSTLIAPKIR
jgi:hypothetical protein